MKKIIIFLLAICIISCSSNDNYYQEEEYVYEPYEYTHEQYDTMFAFVNSLYVSDLFGIPEPTRDLTYKQLMCISAPIIMTDTFGDTIGEGYCYDVYVLVLDFFRQEYPTAKIVYYLQYLIDNNLY